MKRILAVSTDHQLLILLDKQITNLGFKLNIIESQHDLLNKIAANKPDILIIDFILGDENAAALIHQITSGSEMGELPVIVVSDMPGIEQTAAKAGSFAVVKKPMSTEALAENIITALMQHAHSE